MVKIYSVPFGESGFLEFFFNPYLEELGYTPSDEPSLYSFYKGKVLREDKTLGGFFVDIDEGEAFLPYHQITGKVKVEDSSLFQIIREKVEDKPPRLTQKFRINLCGCFFIYREGWNFSAENCKKFLKFLVIFLNFLEASKKLGLIVKWSFSLTKLLESCGNLTLIAESFPKGMLSILEIFNLKPVIQTKSLAKILKEIKFKDSVNKVISERVDFEDGFMLIKTFEGFTLIDVNGYRNPYLLNLKAAETIYFLIRLRKIGGTIVVDFANIRNPKERVLFENRLRSLLKKVNCKGLGFTKGELYEIVCPKNTPSIEERLFVYSDYCGCRIKRDELLALEILERLAQFGVDKPEFKLHPLRKKVEKLVKKYESWIEFVYDSSVGLNYFSI